MTKAEIIDFFNRCAANWDADMVRNEEVINTILDNAGIMSGKTVLDVACGTGVLIPDYLDREVLSVTGIDIADEMVKIAKNKFTADNVEIICGDIEEACFPHGFDCIVVYNAFPHFPDPKRLVKKLISLLNPGGTLTVAHGMSREKLTRHHSGSACKISIPLICEDELAGLFEPELKVTTKISDEKMYQVTGRNNN